MSDVTARRDAVLQAQAGNAHLANGVKCVSSSNDDDGDGSWPPPPTSRTYAITGVLADRIRKRFAVGGALPQRAKVTLTETTTYGGYSEYTQENESDITVRAGDREVMFLPDREETVWISDARTGFVLDSVFARFDAWLNMANDTDSRIVETFTMTHEDARFTRWDLAEGTVLRRTLCRRFHDRPFHLERVYIPASEYVRTPFYMWLLVAERRQGSNAYQPSPERFVLTSSTSLDTEQGVPASVYFALGDMFLTKRF